MPKKTSMAEKNSALEFLKTHTYDETSLKFGVSKMTLSRWKKSPKLTFIDPAMNSEPFPSPEELSPAIKKIAKKSYEDDINEAKVRLLCLIEDLDQLKYGSAKKHKRQLQKVLELL